MLVVEDEPTLRETLAESLALEGLEVVTAADGAEGLERFRTARPDLILLDLMLPEIAGADVCRIIRRESSVPILMLTARSAEADLLLGLEIGADDYVTKPFSLRELQARIRALLRRSERRTEAAAAGRLDLGGVRVDLQGRLVVRGDERISLAPRAFELLTYLAAHAGEVLDRDRLLDAVWGADYPGGTRTVDVHVHAVRQAIEADPARPRFVQTVRGVGYVLRLDEPGRQAP
ncbi:MAG TPA: response regulator transcription factor [Candidatus Limnocylindrales bacterium]